METTATKPVGGFVFVSATGLLAAWWAYKRRFIQFRDFRAWLACHELLAQRCGLQQGRTPHFTVRELEALVGGVGGEHIRASIRRLERVGLLHWSTERLRPASTVTEIRSGDPDDLAAFVQCVQNHRRKVPVPRKLLKLLARESRPVFVATALGHLLRCMYYRQSMCRGNGLCKASWIAGVFEVDGRNVKAARQELVERRIVFRQPTQPRRSRAGLAMCFNFEWGKRASREIPPQAALPTSEIPPLRRTGNSFGRSTNQKPGSGASAGVRKRTAPNMAHVLHADLAMPDRLLVLLADAHRRGLVGSSDAERLQFCCAAAHALRLGTSNPCGMFATVVRRGLWHYASHADEDVGRRTLQDAGETHLIGPTFERSARPRHAVVHERDPEVIRSLIRQSLYSGIGMGGVGASGDVPAARQRLI